MKLSEFPEIKALDVTILSSRTEVSPCLRVTAASDKMKAAADAVNKQVTCIVNERHTYSKAGESKVLEKHQAALKARAKEFECKLYLTREEKPQTNLGPIERYEAILSKEGYLPAHLIDKRISSPQNETSLPAQKPNENTPPLLPPKSVAGQKVVIGGVTVLLNKGDITKEAVDAIVNSNNVNLDLDTGVSGAILRAAGKSVVDECTKLGTQKADGVVVTGGGNLNCKHIIQMVGPNTAADIVTSIEKVLQVCESKQITTVSIPAIGTGRGNIKPEDSIQAVLNGLENHLSQVTSSCIKTVFIVAFDQKVFDSFHAYFVKRNQKSPRSQQAGAPRYLFHLLSRWAQLPANQVKIHGIRVEVKKGDITTETVRGIVNTTNKDLNLKGGVSGAMFRAAGSLVEEECKKFVKEKGPLGDNGVAVTSGGALQCDFIIHMAGPHTLAEVTDRVEKVLESCEKQGVTTVSFPAVGTGGGKLNATDVSIAMLRGFDNHLSQHSPTVLKLIYIVIDKDNVLQGFLQGLRQWSNIPLDNSSDADDEDEGSEGEDNWSTTCEVDDEGGESSIEIIIGPMKVKVLCGDIIDEKTDAIVNSTNTSLTLNSGVSGAILRAAGQEVVKECKALGTQPDDGVVVTKPGKLQSKHIIHMVGQTKAKDITNSMYKVLGTCETIKAQSVSFPALGTGAGKLGGFEVAGAMIDAVSNFVLDKPKSSLKAIHIVLFQKKMMSDFEQVMKKFKKVTPNPGLAATPQKKLYATLPNLSRSQTSSDTTITNLADTTASVTFPVMVAEVYGVSAANLAQVKRCLDELVAEECTSQDVETEHLHLLTESEKQAIAAMSQKDQVKIQVLQNKLKVTGKTNDVLLAIQHIKDSLQRARERENLEREEKRLKKTICWEVEKSQSWKHLDTRTNYNMELAFHKKDQLWTYQDRGVSFTVDFKNMTQKDSRGNTMKIKRTLLGDSETAIIDPPPTWTKLGGKDLDVIALTSESEEFKTISAEFLLSCQFHTQESGKLIEVVQIQRIQNQEQWQRYAVSKQAVDRKYPKSTNEQFLYHGTTKDTCQKINKNGFNRSFCGRNATKFGNGTYFAKQAYYSCHNSYSKPDEEGLKYIYRARVLTGKPCIGNKGMKEPSPVDPNNDQAGLHDCAVDNLQNPFIFVIFCDSGAYPDYLITFKLV
ncbi:hypothetical protein AGOR_G00214850 [Albula goreensis]|uniref:Poly [ADP-ribose] polymerase n=1 Tax=Albula goreensis TaxID=1534307 RepID=A0A8T3CIK2_9TELE|nr:hypothetical protein AGOR_G00214850 [Albula goreensis]